MKKIAAVFLTAGLMATTGTGQMLNPDSPAKGRWDFQLEKMWHKTAAGEYFFLRVSDIAVDENGNLFVFDRKHARVIAMDAGGHYLFAFGRKGEGPGEYRRADRIQLLGDRVIIPEAGRAHIFSRQGKHLISLRFEQHITPRHFLDADRFIYYHNQLDSEGRIKADQIRLYDLKTRENRLISEFGGAWELDLNSADLRLSIHVDDICTHLDADALFMAKGDRFCIQRYSLPDGPLQTFSIEDRQPRRISLDWKKQKYGNLKINGKKLPPDMIRDMINEMPDFSDCISRILTDPRGNLYLLIGDEENETTQEVDIFSPGGRYLYRGEWILPEGLAIDSPQSLELKGNFLYAFARNPDGDGCIVKASICLPR